MMIYYLGRSINNLTKYTPDSFKYLQAEIIQFMYYFGIMIYCFGNILLYFDLIDR